MLVSGHEEILAIKDHIMTDKEFVLSMMEITKQAVQTVPSDDVVQTCVDDTTAKWQGKLRDLDKFMVEHCTAMQEYILSQ